MPESHALRRERLCAAVAASGADAALITTLVNVRYLTGFTGSNGIVLVGPDTRVFLTDFRYVEQSAAEVDATFDRQIGQELMDLLPGVLPSSAGRVAFEDAHVTVRRTRYASEDTGWAVVEAAAEDGAPLVLVGPLTHLEERERAHIVGTWVEDRRYGPQVYRWCRRWRRGSPWTSR